MNLGEDDWLLGLDSETEGDEDNVLYDMDNDEGVNDLSDEPGDGGDDSDHEDFPIPDSTAPVSNPVETPVVFGLGDEQLGQLQQDGWETYD
ncbi:Hypothetical protein PHPALM_36592 [Phytophthora palmivora]|uniref:Uncharacterized protein n=1 Tax=Phytophthora palmivora TaxID=4796 RepID=A0A2P4WZJ5_9STRA|nr:Hypothetical protein PHPALM_36592 [Phytophthora palmivora]